MDMNWKGYDIFPKPLKEKLISPIDKTIQTHLSRWGIQNQMGTTKDLLQNKYQPRWGV